jgi:hypothetical protein
MPKDPNVSRSGWARSVLSVPRIFHVPARPIGWKRGARQVIVAGIALYAAATVVRLYARKYDVFVPGYLAWLMTAAPAPSDRPTHVFFMFVDHFEPDYDAERVRRWAYRYRELAGQHHDGDGRPPQHTWFYPGEQGQPEVMRELQELTADGLGEVELHYHHDYDTAATLRPKLVASISDFQRYGFLKTTDGRTCFAFIHGNEGLDNSNGPATCGVNTELRLLRELGCFADFTFPAIFKDAQPPFVNEIYAAADDDQPKSYARHLPLSALESGRADLMIFQGPLVFAPSLNAFHLFLDLDDGNVHATVLASPQRVDRWVRAGIHVAERPDWVFVKVFAHGISTEGDEEAVLGPSFDKALSYLERQYDDGRRYVLHYITSREGYNLARAAADGLTGDPTRYFDNPIPPYVADGVRGLPLETRASP